LPSAPSAFERTLGFERTLAYVTGLANVRDAIPFPRTPGNARY
jgi:asparaginyl-tRNA synthetase